MSGRRAVFFDRDGALIEEVEYLVDEADIKRLVLTGNGKDEVLRLEQGVPKLEKPDYIGSDILRAVTWTLERISE